MTMTSRQEHCHMAYMMINVLIIWANEDLEALKQALWIHAIHISAAAEILVCPSEATHATFRERQKLVTMLAYIVASPHILV
jgi:hypothetical protein